MPRPQSAAETHSPPRLPTPPAEEPRWLIWCDGSACPNPGRMGFGAVLRGPDGSTHTLSQAGHTSGCNNEAEARALLQPFSAEGLEARPAPRETRASVAPADSQLF